MEYAKFISLPTQLKIQIINKCLPISYVRLRRTCRFADEFCEEYRKYLGVYCDENDAGIALDEETNNHYVWLSNPESEREIKIPMTPENMNRIKNTVSGFVLHEFEFNNHFHHESYDDALNYFLKTVPDFKVCILGFRNLCAKQVEMVMESSLRIGGIKIDCQFEMWRILQIGVIRKKDPAWYYWDEDDTDFTEQDIAELARGKKNITIQPSFLSKSSCLHVLKTIAQNWKDDGQYPRNFYIDWNNDREYMDADISGFYSEIMEMEALHLGSFLELHPGADDCKTINDIWIKMDKDTKQWQLVILLRTDDDQFGIAADFTFKSGSSSFELFQKLIKFLEESYSDFIFDYSTLYEAYHVTNDLEKFKEAFVNIVPKLVE